MGYFEAVKIFSSRNIEHVKCSKYIKQIKLHTEHYKQCVSIALFSYIHTEKFWVITEQKNYGNFFAKVVMTTRNRNLLGQLVHTRWIYRRAQGNLNDEGRSPIGARGT